MPVKLRRVDNKMYNRVPSYSGLGCLGCDFRLGHGNCALGTPASGTMCKEDERYFIYRRAHTFKY